MPSSFSVSLHAAAVGGLAMLVLVTVYAFLKLRRNTAVHIVVIVLLSLLALVVRLPHINRPLSCHHEVLTAMSMITLENWQRQGALEHNFCLLQTYPLNTDRFIMNRGMRSMDKQGRGYYTSFPPFSIMLPYALFRLIRIEPSVLGLQIFNLVCHLLAAILIYLTVAAIAPDGPARRYGALLASAVFIFLPANLWFFSNTYSWDIFWLYLWIAGLYLVARLDLAVSERRPAGRFILLLGIVGFFLVYTDHHGALFALSVVVYSLVRLRAGPYRNYLIGTAVATSAAAILLVLLQYSTIAGPEDLCRRLLAAASERSILSPCNPLRILSHYGFAYLSAIPVIALAGAGLVYSRSSAGRGVTGGEVTLMLMSAATILLHHIVFLEWTAVHDYSALKASVFVSLLVGIGCARVVAMPVRDPIRACALLGALAFTLYLSLAIHEHHFARCYEPGRCAALGAVIRKQSFDDEVVFALPGADDPRIDPRVIYYAGRNIQNVHRVREARAWLEAHGRSNGVVYEIARAHRVVRVDRIGDRSETNPQR